MVNIKESPIRNHVQTYTKSDSYNVKSNFRRDRRRYRAHRHKKGKKKKIHTVFDSESEEELEDEDFANMQIPVLEDALANRP